MHDIREGRRALRVAHLIARLPASGTERQLAGMVRAARDAQLWDPTVVVLFQGFDLAAELRQDGIDVVELHGGPPWHPGRAARLDAVLRAGAFDVVHTSLWGGSAFGRAVAAARRPRPALVMSERRVEDFRRPAQRVVDRALRGLTDAWIGNSADVAAFVGRAHGVGPDRVTTIPNGIDQTVFTPQDHTPDDGVLRIGAVGRLVPQKGFDVLLRALPAVLEHRPAQLVIIGEGPRRERLEAAAAGLPVELRGFLGSPAEVAAFLQGLHVFAMPSRYEGLPNALIEAQACGVPCVASDAPGIREASGAGVLLVPPEDPGALAQAILAQADRGRVTPPAGLRTFEVVAAEHLAVFREALRRRGRPDDVIPLPEAAAVDAEAQSESQAEERSGARSEVQP